MATMTVGEKISRTKQAKKHAHELKCQRVSESLLALFEERRKAKARKSAKIRRWWRLHREGLV